MPNLESLENFNSLLIETGNEPRIAAERGEAVEAVRPPSPGEFGAAGTGVSTPSADDFFASLSDSLAETGDEPPEGLAPPETDFLSDLGIDEEPALPDFSLDESPELDQGESDFLDFDLEGYAGESSGFEDSYEEAESGQVTGMDDGEPFADQDFESSSGGDETESFSMDDFGSFDDESETGTAGDEDAFIMEDFSDIDIEEEAPEAGAAADDEGFSMDDFGSLGDEAPGPGDEDETESFSMDDFGSFDDESETGTASDEDAFIMEDFSDIEEEVPETGDAGFSTEDFSDFGEVPGVDSAGDKDIFSMEADDAPAGADDGFGQDFEEGFEFSDEEGPDSFSSVEDFGVPDDFAAAADFSEPAGFPGTGDFPEDEAAGLDSFEDFDGGFDTGDFGDEFSMGDFGAEFGIMDDAGAGFRAEDVEIPGMESASAVDESLEEASLEDQAAGFKLSDEDFSALQGTMADLPLNLKLAVAGVISSGDYPFETVKKLIDALVARKSARDIAQLASRITGRKIEIPRGYEKRSGVAFEKEKASFAYRFRESIWPVLRLMLAGTMVLSALLYTGYRFVYRPLYANSLYELGLQNIELGEYSRAEDFFAQAWDVWPVNQRYLDFARAYRSKRQVSEAQDKYEELLSPAIDPENKEAILEFADFAVQDLRAYELALEYLQRPIEKDPWDYEARLAKGDTYLEWAISGQSADRGTTLEEARFEYASLMTRYGQTDELLFRMLRYFIHNGNVEDALALKDLFLTDERAVLDPRGLAELAGFLLDISQDSIGRFTIAGNESAAEAFVAGLKGDDPRTGLINDTLALLNKAMALDDRIPEIHYHRARHARITGSIRDERTALLNARELYEELRVVRELNGPEVAREIDTYIREAELFYELREFLNAETRLRQADERYERALNARKVEPGPVFGRMYALLGDIYYYEANNYEDAGRFYSRARENFFGRADGPADQLLDRQDIAYKMGFIHYFAANREISRNADEETRRQDLLDQAITEFNNALGSIPTANINLLYARANTQYQRGFYADAASLYRILLEELTTRRDSISTFLLEEDDRHRALIDFQVRVNNNLGVALYRLYLQGGTRADRYLAESQLYMSRSTELAENLVRDTDTAVRADTRPLAYLNLTRVLAPGMGTAVQIDPDLRKDLVAGSF